MIEKEDIQKLILDKKKSTLKAHFNDAFFINNLRYSGEIRKDEILLWYSSYWFRGGYPVFHLKFDYENKLVGIKTELNPFGKLLRKIIPIIFGIFALLPIFGNGFEQGWFGSFFVLLVAFVLFLIMRKVSKIEKKIMTEELKETIENIEKEKFPEKFIGLSEKDITKENEWTLKKIITRTFFYPFCIGIIYLCFTGFIPKGQYFHGIFGIAVCGAYLYSDLYAIFKK